MILLLKICKTAEGTFTSRSIIESKPSQLEELYVLMTNMRIKTQFGREINCGRVLVATHFYIVYCKNNNAVLLYLTARLIGLQNLYKKLKDC